jgi:predicted ribosome quality control (RQC) complex YloA/Tae2 family protein
MLPVADKKALSAASYEQAPEYLQHVEEVLASYEHPKGLLGELVAQLADAFWWIKIYRRDKENLIVLHMTTALMKQRPLAQKDQQLWLAIFEALSKELNGYTLDEKVRKTLKKIMTSKGYNLASLRAEATREVLPQIDTLDRLIDRQFKNIRLIMQAHDSAKFAPQLHKKLELEIKQLELQVEKSYEDQRLEVARQ